MGSGPPPAPHAASTSRTETFPPVTPSSLRVAQPEDQDVCAGPLTLSLLSSDYACANSHLTTREQDSTNASTPPPAPKRAFLEAQKALANPVLASFMAGGVAGAVSRTVVSPLERLKILFQIQSVGNQEYKLSVGKALGKMWREEGLKGFMRGNGTNCIRIVPYSAVQFGSYNFYKRVSWLCGGVPRSLEHVIRRGSTS